MRQPLVPAGHALRNDAGAAGSAFVPGVFGCRVYGEEWTNEQLGQQVLLQYLFGNAVLHAHVRVGLV